MEINTIEYFRILKERLLNLMELKLHRGVFISITLPHTPKRLHQFYLFNKLQEGLHTTSHADDLIQSPLRKVRFPLTSAPLDVVERKQVFFPQRNWLMNLACLYHEIQQDSKGQDNCTRVDVGGQTRSQYGISGLLFPAGCVTSCRNSTGGGYSCWSKPLPGASSHTYLLPPKAGQRLGSTLSLSKGQCHIAG